MQFSSPNIYKILKYILWIYLTGCVKPIHPNPMKKVHFSAYLSQHTTFNVGDVVKFKQVTLNQGNAYSPSTGVFTCPQSGIYQVTWFFIYNRTESSKLVWLRWEVNEATYAFAGLHTDEPHNPAFRSHLIHLKKGDRLRIVSHSNNMAVSGNSDRHTGFSALYVSAWSKADEINIIQENTYHFFLTINLKAKLLGFDKSSSPNVRPYIKNSGSIPRNACVACET